MGEAVGGNDNPHAAGGTPSRRLAAIMFTDLVGYSALAHRDERLAIELLELHRSWIREILPRHGGIEIETVGDAFLIEFAGTLAAVECAVAIQNCFADHNKVAPTDRRIELRIGIHLGDIEHKDGKVMGDGVNIASRIHGMAEPGGICVSDAVQQAVHGQGLSFEDLGAPALKNIDTHLRLYALSAVPPTTATRVGGVLRRSRRSLTALATVVLLAVIGVGAWRAGFFKAHPVVDKSVAVLPFENLSADPDNAFFTDGLHDTVIGHLARIEDLKVISRTSVMRYRGQRGDLKRIAGELGVAHILEGSVQRTGSRLRVATQLIDAATDVHVWSDEYDRDLADTFAVQADIARQVATAVHAKLTPREQEEIERIPTQNQQAYDLYLRALAATRRTDVEFREIEQGIALLEQAVSLDPGFALAYTGLVRLHDRVHWYGLDTSDSRKAMIRRNVEIALKLAPDLTEARTVRALELYHLDERYADALTELEFARQRAPGDAQVLRLIGLIYGRQGRWEEALSMLAQAVAVDPFNEQLIDDYALELRLTRRYRDAERLYERLKSLAPDSWVASYALAEIRFLQTGILQPMWTALEAAPADSDFTCLLRWQLRWLRREFREAAVATMACPQAYFLGEGPRTRTPKEFYAALAYAWAGDEKEAREHAKRARAELGRSLDEDPDQVLTRMRLALTHALLGQFEAARVECERALQAMPESRDAILARWLRHEAAKVYAVIGNTDLALGELRLALLEAHYAQLDPAFDSLRADPRFQKLIEDRMPRDEGA